MEVGKLEINVHENTEDVKTSTEDIKKACDSSIKAFASFGKAMEQTVKGFVDAVNGTSSGVSNIDAQIQSLKAEAQKLRELLEMKMQPPDLSKVESDIANARQKLADMQAQMDKMDVSDIGSQKWNDLQTQIASTKKTLTQLLFFQILGIHHVLFELFAGQMLSVFLYFLRAVFLVLYQTQKRHQKCCFPWYAPTIC